MKELWLVLDETLRKTFPPPPILPRSSIDKLADFSLS